MKNIWTGMIRGGWNDEHIVEKRTLSLKGWSTLLSCKKLAPKHSMVKRSKQKKNCMTLNVKVSVSVPRMLTTIFKNLKHI